ncbi:MAG: GNAT family N-acetyltransferase [Betaproteobacteria bacterium]|nr:GNAT family N-acetyltransferase [Betaproteobacteria bacterium]
MPRNIEIHRRSEAHARQEFDSAFSTYISTAMKSSDDAVNLERQGYSKFALNYAQTRECEFWMATDAHSGDVIARLGADFSKSMENLGSVGFFDCEPTPVGKSAAVSLLANAYSWLKEKGACAAVGPMDFNSWFQYRFKVKNHESAIPDFPWEPPPCDFHLELFKESGFSEHIRYSSFFFELPSLDLWDAYIARLETDHKRVLASGYSITGIRWDENLEPDLRKIFMLLNRAFAQSPMFEEIPFEVFSAMTLSTLRSKNCAGSSLCFSQEGELVAFLFSFVSHDTAIYKTIAVHPDFQSLGIGNALTLELCKACRQMGLLKSAGALIRSGNNSEMIGRGFAKFAAASGLNEYILMRKDLL